MDEVSPTPLPPASTEQLTDMASDLRDIGISKDLEQLLARGIHSSKLPKQLRGAKAAEAVQQAFEIIGGVPRLALWADRNPDKFFALYARMIPQTVAPVVADLPTTNKSSQIPTFPWLTARRHLYMEGLEIAQDVLAKNKQET